MDNEDFVDIASLFEDDRSDKLEKKGEKVIWEERKHNTELNMKKIVRDSNTNGVDVVGQ